MYFCRVGERRAINVHAMILAEDVRAGETDGPMRIVLRHGIMRELPPDQAAKLWARLVMIDPEPGPPIEPDIDTADASDELIVENNPNLANPSDPEIGPGRQSG